MRFTRKALTAMVLVAGAFAVSAPGTAIAGEPGDYSGCSIAIDPSTAEPGDTINVVGTGFQDDGFTTEIFVDDILAGEATTDGVGAFDVDVVVPEGAGPGLVAVTAACDASGESVSSSDLTVPGDTVADLTLSASSVERLEEFVATVTNAEPGSTVSFERFSVAVPVGDSVADADGTATLTISFPADATLGAHEVQATGVDAEGDDFVLTDPIEVVADGSLPTTGRDVEPLVIAGGAAILAGAAFVLVAKRRRRTAD